MDQVVVAIYFVGFIIWLVGCITFVAHAEERKVVEQPSLGVVLSGAGVSYVVLIVLFNLVAYGFMYVKDALATWMLG